MAKPITKAQQTASINWLIGRARTAAGYRRNIVNNSGRARDFPQIGKMFFFFYDPKHKETLPLYDRFPLVFPIEPYIDGFLGLNVHYLTIPQRQAFLGKMMQFATNTKLNEKTRLRLSYDLLQSTKGVSKYVGPCIKRYLYSHVRSDFIEIQAQEWQMAIALPVEQFVFQ